MIQGLDILGMKRTSKPEYVVPIMDALGIMGVASEDELLDKAFSLIHGRLFPDDLTLLPNGVPRWRNQMQHMLDGLIESGKIEKKNGLLRLSDS
jgi:hypothetical protein